MYSKKGKISGLLGRAESIQFHKEKLHRIADYCNSIVTLNKWYAQMLVNNGLDPKKISVIQQGLPFSAMTDNSIVNSPKSGIPLRIVFVGRIYPAKGLHVLLSALVKLKPEIFRLDIYGASNDDNYLNKCQQMVGDNPSIQFCGIIPPGQTVSYLKKYQLLVLPSIVTEMAPLVIQEAFAAGIPVIASEVYGNCEQIRYGENGFLFKCNDIHSLQVQIQKCIDEPLLLQRLAANITPPSDFTVVAAGYEQLYRKILSDQCGYY